MTYFFLRPAFLNILIKITQCQDLVRIFLQNRTTDFDETLHVASVCPGEGFSTIGTSGYSPVQKKAAVGRLCMRDLEIKFKKRF